ncbi:multiple inositol polyphosphate phosphatase 1 [Diachasma alloeum]|uniref:multiple inositol polyphosphate phosphatase 1 n=1 Tax=Diachasma alloeum TaxID=454923 RepID=UPI0007383960|nr:multiple inositol polyphosphate phosphatase 1 [Diachasma alloeum]
MKLVIFLALCIGCTWARNTDYCFAENGNPYLQFASVTPYIVSTRGRNEYQQIPNCQPRQIWMLSRHGIRYPNADDIVKLMELRNVRDQILINHEQRSDGRLCNEDLDNLRNWSPNANMTTQMAKELTPQGMTESKLLAGQIRVAFPQLFPRTQGDISQDYVFRATKSMRSQASMRAFMEGLLSRSVPTPPPFYGNDTLLKAYQYCPRWKDGDENDPHYGKELADFLRGHEFSDLIRNVSSRLGFQYQLSADKIRSMYDMCRYEKAWAVEKLSPWCAIFSNEELKVMEYTEDLEYYYTAGYGREVNKIIGCFPLQDMMNRFRSLEQNDANDKPKGIFYFTHTVTILSFLRNLGAFQDSEPLTANNYRNMMRRRWSTSALAPFSSNVVAVFYRCNDNDARDKVMFYLQGKPLPLEGCQVGLCNWEYLKTKLGETASQCSEDNCYGRGGSMINQALITLISVFSLSCILLK